MRAIGELRASIKAVIKMNDYSNTQFFIRRPYMPDHPFWYVMIRVHDLSGTHYSYTFKMDDAEARAVVKSGILRPWFTNEDFFKQGAA